jgi:HEAT repeat protein
MQAAHDRDQSAIPHLIESLDSDDSAVRLMAIGTLEELTGQTLGYRHEDPLWRRQQAVDRWVAWYDQHHPPAKEPDRTPEP